MTTDYVLWLEQEVARLRETLIRIAHLEHDLEAVKNLAAEALRDEDSR